MRLETERQLQVQAESLTHNVIEVLATSGIPNWLGTGRRKGGIA